MGCVKNMAYLRKEEETVEIDHSLNRVWVAVQRVLKSLDWNVEQIDEAGHRVKAKTKAGPMSWSSVFLVDVVSVNENTTRVTAAAETPVTTITAIVDFGQGKRRIAHFFRELSKELAS
jgi:hypothetical protein